MDFDLLAETVLSDVRTKKIPILYVIELLNIMIFYQVIEIIVLTKQNIKKVIKQKNL